VQAVERRKCTRRRGIIVGCEKEEADIYFLNPPRGVLKLR
jgi:hypothetical protein